jgi:hypothetical protein
MTNREKLMSSLTNVEDNLTELKSVVEELESKGVPTDSMKGSSPHYQNDQSKNHRHGGAKKPNRAGDDGE